MAQSDGPKVQQSDFSASLIQTPGLPHNLTVKGKAVGDYRVSEVKLVRSPRQNASHLLRLEITAKLGPVQNPHPELERVWPLEFDEKPAHHHYSEVEIINGSDHFMVGVRSAL